MRSREEIMAQFPERDADGIWEVTPQADSRWRAAVLEVLLDIRELLFVLERHFSRGDKRPAGG